jgi:hypothetical protein
MSKTDYMAQAEEPGDCWARCIEFCMGIDPGSSDIPRPTWDEVTDDLRLHGDYSGRLGLWLQKQRHAVIEFRRDVAIPGSFWSPAWVEPEDRHYYPMAIWEGMSVKKPWLGHCVVVRGYLDAQEVLFDPSGLGVSEPLSVSFVISG